MTYWYSITTVCVQEMRTSVLKYHKGGVKYHVNVLNLPPIDEHDLQMSLKEQSVRFMN
jgi:hypothetical protein